MLLLPRFHYHDPTTLEEACRIMAELGERAKPLAGGTDLLVNMKKGLLSPETVLSLGRIDPLRDQRRSNGELRIGACMTVAELAESGDVKEMFHALSSGANSLGSPLIRNLATVGGNIASARPAADLPPPLMAYGARVVLRQSSGERTVSLDDFFRGPGETVMAPEEILTEIVIEKPPENAGAAYMKLGVRKTLEISIVNVAAYLSLDGPDGAITTARVVLGAVAPVPMRAPSAEGLLMGRKPDESLFAEAGEAAARDSRPIDDLRGSAGYRKDMVAILTRRTLGMAHNQARSS